MEKYKLHDAIHHEVNTLLEKGKKRITVLMPAGCGKQLLLGRIVKSLQVTTVVIVSHHIIRDSLIQRKEELFDSQSVTILTVSDFKNSQFDISECTVSNPYLIVLFETVPKDRESIAKLIPEEATVLSFGSDFRIKDVSFENEDVYPFECTVFFSESLLDVRDSIVGTETDRQSIIHQVIEKRNKEKNLLLAIAASGPLASPEAPPEVVAELEKKIKELEKTINEKNETLRVYEWMLSSFGVPREDIKRNANIIKSIKDKYEDGEPDTAIENIAKAISEQCQRLLANYVTSYSAEYYSSLIESSITEEVWKKLEQESQNCLITGKIAFRSMLNTGDDSLDYSGVCILASKALDIEISKRFFHNYLSYLSNRYPKAKWPNTMFDKDGAVLTDDKFTLGSVRFVAGTDEYGDIKNQYAYNFFIRYAQAELYDPSLTTIEIKEHLKNCVQSVETVREKYRNPAAHRTPLSKVTAEECFDYLIDTYKKLKEILEVMK